MFEMKELIPIRLMFKTWLAEVFINGGVFTIIE